MNKLKWFILPVLMIVSFVLIGKTPLKAYYLSDHVENIYNYVPDYQNPTVVEYNGADMDLFFGGVLYNNGLESFGLSSLTTDMLNINFPIGQSNLVMFPMSLGSIFWTSSTGPINQLAYIIYQKTANDTVILSFYNLNNEMVLSYPNLYLDTPSVYYPRASNVQYEYQKGYNEGYGVGYDNGLYEGSTLSYDNGYNNGYDYGYDYGYDVGLQDGSNVLNNVWLLFEAVLEVIADVFTLEIFPNVTIGTLFMIPISFAMFKWFLKIIK